MSVNRVWIEIESPYKDNGNQVKDRTWEEACAIGDARAQQVTRMLHRLGILPNIEQIVWWDKSDRRRGYCWTRDEAGGFMYTDHGEPGMWYNLEWLGREE